MLRVFEGILDNEEYIFLAEAIINLAQDDALLTLAILSNFATIVDKIIKINKKYDCQEAIEQVVGLLLAFEIELNFHSNYNFVQFHHQLNS